MSCPYTLEGKKNMKSKRKYRHVFLFNPTKGAVTQVRAHTHIGRRPIQVGMEPVDAGRKPTQVEREACTYGKRWHTQASNLGQLSIDMLLIKS